MLNKIKNIFKKEEPKVNLQITDLKVGYVVDYFMESWEVKEEGEYDWGNNVFAKEYLIDNGRQKQFLYVAENGTELDLSLSKTISINDIDRNVTNTIIKTDDGLESFEYKGQTYYLRETSQGEYREVPGEDWSEFVSYDYVNDAGDAFVSISRWAEESFEAVEGTYVKEFEFSNILPNK